MKKIKALACVLTVAMLAGIFAGCSKTTKISTDKFAKACEKMKLIEFDLYDGSPDEDDYEQGVYTIVDEDMIEDEPEMMTAYLDELGLGDIIDPDDVKSMGIAFKFKGMEDIDSIEDPEDLEDVKVDGAFAMQIELADNYVGDFMDFVDDKLDSAFINSKDLSNKEYYTSKNDGFFRFHIDVAKLLKMIQDNDDLMELIDEMYGEDEFDDLCKNLSGDMAITVEINGSNIFILGGVAVNSKPTALNTFASGFGATNPTKVPMNTKFFEGYIEDLFENFGDMAGSMGGSSYYDDYDYDYDFDDYDLDVDDWDI